jgi:hypothetical protein
MRRVAGFSEWSGVIALLMVSVASAGAAQQLPATDAAAGAVAEEVVHTPEQFTGVWDYNADESINIATGKPEQSPRSATQRTAAARAGGAGPGGGGGRAGSGGYGGGYGAGGGPSRGSGTGLSPEMLRASRDLVRDLMEIPESLTVAVTPADITFTDDLNRTRTFPTDGSKHRYQLGASQFSARVEWRDSQLRKDIDGDFGFKMSETYLLSPDASRLFVVLRVPTSGRNAIPIGADRVYDRAVPGATPAGGAAR